MYRPCCCVTELSSTSALWVVRGKPIVTSNSQANLRAGQILRIFEKAENSISHLFPKGTKDFFQKPWIVEMPFAEEGNGMGSPLPHGAGARHSHGPK